jgi:hypothetical protein
MMLIPGLI